MQRDTEFIQTLLRGAGCVNTNVNIIWRQHYPASKVTESVVTNVWVTEEGGGAIWVTYLSCDLGRLCKKNKQKDKHTNKSGVRKK